MKIRIYTEIEIKELKNNIFIKDILYQRQIKYEPIFKLWTIMMRLEYPGLLAKEIFEIAGINTKILHPKLPQRRIKEWLDNYKKYGLNYFLPEESSYSTLSTNNSKEVDFKNGLYSYVIERLKRHNDYW